MSWSEWAFSSILGGMKALSSLAGYDIIFHSATNVMTDSKSLLDQCFYEGSTVSMATHHLWPAVSTQSWQTTAYPTQPYTVRCLETQFYSILSEKAHFEVEPRQWDDIFMAAFSVLPFSEGQHKLPQTAKIPEAFRNWDCVEPAKHPLCCNGHQTGRRKGHLHITHILLCGLVSLVTL